MSHPVQTTSPELIFPPGAERRRGSQGAGCGCGCLCVCVVVCARVLVRVLVCACACAVVRVCVCGCVCVLFPASLKPAVISFLQLGSDTAPARGGSHDIDH